MNQYFVRSVNRGKRVPYSMRVYETTIQKIKEIENTKLFNVVDSIANLIDDMYEQVKSSIQNVYETHTERIQEEVTTNIPVIDTRKKPDPNRRTIVTMGEELQQKSTPTPDENVVESDNDKMTKEYTPKQKENIKLYVAWIKEWMELSKNGNRLFTMTRMPDKQRKWLITRKLDGKTKEIWWFDFDDGTILPQNDDVCPLYMDTSDYQIDMYYFNEWIRGEMD